MNARERDSSSLEELNRQALDRLYPALTNPNYLILRKRREIFQTWLRNVPGSHLKVLDVGGRLQPYRSLVGARVGAYVAVDLCQSALVSIIAKGEQLPLASDVFDLAFCTQMLEFVPDPRTALAEIHRVLKPGGVLLLSVSTLFPRASDEEHWRFQPAAIHVLLAGFSKFEVQPEGNSITGFLRTVSVFLIYGSRSALLKRALGYLLVLPLNLLARAMEAMVRTNDTTFTANYSAIARK